MFTITKLLSWSTRTMWWTSDNSIVRPILTGCPTSWMCSPGPCLSSEKKVWHSFVWVTFTLILVTNKPGPAQIGASLKFLEYAKYNLFKLLSLSQYFRKIPQRIRIRLGNHIFPNWKTFFFGSLCLNYLFSSRKPLWKREGRVPFDQMKVSEKTHNAKNA